LKVCSEYRHPADEGLSVEPADLEGVKPVYISLPGWQADLHSARTWEELPAPARDFVLAVQHLSGVRIEYLSVGPERDQLIERGEA